MLHAVAAVGTGYGYQLHTIVETTNFLDVNSEWSIKQQAIGCKLFQERMELLERWNFLN